MDIVDPHLHFFNHDAGDYHWLSLHNPPYWPDKSQLYVPALPHLLPADGRLRVRGFVHIEAGFDNQRPWREIHWLTRICTTPFKAVAGIDLTGPDFLPQLAALCRLPAISGVRHILDDQAASILSTPQTRHRLTALADAGLSFDAQFSLADASAIAALCRLLEAIPELKVILNHAGMPVPTGTESRQWLAGLKALAAYPQVAIKLSGWEMQQRDWPWTWPGQVLQRVLEEFDVSQVMLASNYPLCRWTRTYSALWQGYARLVPAELQPALLRDNACRWYQLDISGSAQATSGF